MKKAQSYIETLTERQEEFIKKTEFNQGEIIKKIDDIHKIFIMLSGFKRGIIATWWGLRRTPWSFLT